MRIGIGYDAHRLVKGRPLVLGGVNVPSDLGLDGWSDADVLVHAIIDALLGAAGLGDIGTHFPANDPAYKDISSIVLLGRTSDMLRTQGWRVGNIDATVIAERPALQPFADRMRQNIGQALSITASQVGIKATTTEGLGFAGKEEGIAACAVSLIEGTDAAI